MLALNIELIILLGVIFSIIPLPRFSKYNKWFYKWYLTSPRWNKKRYKRYHLQKGLCAKCNKRLDKFHCHHKHYETLGNESMSDIECLHEWCHSDEHKRLNNRPILKCIFEYQMLYLKRVYYSILNI